MAFLSTLCRALAARDADTVVNDLPYYQYNSGLRWGMLGDGEGQTGDPSLMRSWLAASTVRCRLFTPDVAGHGTLLTSGWATPGPWALVEFDTYSGHWKINDFTFGERGPLHRVMHTAGPRLRFHG